MKVRVFKKIYTSGLVNKILAFMYIALRSSYDTKRYNKFREMYEIHPTFKFRGTDINFFGEGTIICGKNSYIGRYSILEAHENCKIVIGNNCAIGPHVKIYTAGRITDQDLNKDPFGKEIKKSSGDIIIGDGCYIGTNVGITEGITIGENAVIGMNSVVTKNIPPHCVAVGSPAKIVKFKSYLSEKEKKELINKFFS